MDTTLLTALLGFAFTTAFSPGPNNLLASNCGAQIGFRASLPLVGAIWLGAAGVLAAVSLGSAIVFSAYPALRHIMALLGSTYLLYLAWSVLTASRRGESQSASVQTNIFTAMAFQLVNPKAWLSATALISTFVPAQAEGRVIVFVVGVFASINLMAIATWAAIGSSLRGALKHPAVDTVYRLVVAFSLVLTVAALNVRS